MIFSKYQLYKQTSNRLKFEMQLGFWWSELSSQHNVAIGNFWNELFRKIY